MRISCRPLRWVTRRRAPRPRSRSPPLDAARGGPELAEGPANGAYRVLVAGLTFALFAQPVLARSAQFAN